MSRLWTYVPSRAEFLCECGVGHYPIWSTHTIHGECTKRCCIASNFPGRQPRRGDIALCGMGTLGIIIAPNKRKVDYPNGNHADAWVGFHLTNAMYQIGNQWSSRNPCIITNIEAFAMSRNNRVDWAATLYALAEQTKIENWPWKKPRTELTPAGKALVDDACNFCVEE